MFIQSVTYTDYVSLFSFKMNLFLKQLLKGFLDELFSNLITYHGIYTNDK